MIYEAVIKLNLSSRAHPPHIVLQACHVHITKLLNYYVERDQRFNFI